jgi:hypothetical protein
MFSKITRSVFTVLLPAGLALVLCSQAAHAQQRGTLMQQQYGWNSGLGRTYGTGQLGSQFHLSTSYYFQYGLQPQLYGQSYNLSQQYGSQALLSAMQQQYTQNALQRYVFEAQLIGADPDEVLQSALLAIQLNQLARLRAPRLQYGR